MDPNTALAEMRAAITEGQRLHDEAWRLCEEANASGSENDEFAVREAAYQQEGIAAERAAALDEWLSKGGFLPDAWARQPKVELLHERDPDSECYVTTWVDGAQVDASIWNVDPGAGHLASEWVPALSDINASTPEVAQAIRGAYVEAAEESPYVENDLNEGGHSIDDGCTAYATGHVVFMDAAERISVPVDRLGIDEMFYEDGKHWRIRGKTGFEDGWHFTLEDWG